MKNTGIKALQHWLRHPVILWISASLGIAIIFFYRFPNNFFFSNFYAEDGSIFAQHLLDNGLFPTIITTFNGYFIVGLYTLSAIAVLFNTILFDHVLYLPQISAMISYGFFGLTIGLPVLLFSKKIQLHWLLLYCLFAAFVPLPSWDYAIIGTIGNTKFFFATIALFLIVGLLWIEPKNRWVRYGIYVGIIGCGYTNPTVYLLCLIFVWKYAQSSIHAIRNKKSLAVWAHSLAFDNRFWEHCLLAGALSFQILWVFVNGIPEQPGYLDTPFEWNKGIEIIIARSFFFSFFIPFYTQLNDSITLLVALIALCALYGLGNRKHWTQYTWLLLGTLAMTLLFIATRPGVSTFFDSYSLPGGPGQFFYPQNITALFLFFFWLNDFVKRFLPHKLIQSGIFIGLLLFLFSSALDAGSYGKNNFMQKRGTFLDEATEVCTKTNEHEQTIAVPVYPSDGWVMQLKRNLVCSPQIIKTHEPEYANFELTPVENNFLASGINASTSFTQTFVSPHHQLSGVTVYFSTFGKKITTPYLFTLSDETCKTTIRQRALDSAQIKDNAFHRIEFEPIAESQDVRYCFTITTEEITPKDLVTIQMSAPDIYTTGQLTLNNEQRIDDVVFSLEFDHHNYWIFEDNMK